MPYAKVKLEIEVESGSNWTKDTTMDQIYKQALEGSMGYLSKVLMEGDTHRRISIVGTPVVTSVYNVMTEKPQ